MTSFFSHRISAVKILDQQFTLKNWEHLDFSFCCVSDEVNHSKTFFLASGTEDVSFINTSFHILRTTLARMRDEGYSTTYFSEYKEQFLAIFEALSSRDTLTRIFIACEQNFCFIPRKRSNSQSSPVPISFSNLRAKI